MMNQDGADPLLFGLLSDAASDLGLSAEKAIVTPLAGDGSDRKFFRIRQGALHFVALVSPRKNPSGIDENDSYYLIGAHLARCGVPVPKILCSDVDRGVFILEDLDDCHMQRLANRGGSDLRSLYRRALKLLLKMHERAPEGFQPSFCFDASLYDPSFVYVRELEYFRTAFLEKYLGLEGTAEELRIDFENIAEAAGAREQELVMHRDFQSRNLMVCKGALRLVDFQGMRFGPPAYDVASLLIDPYVILPNSVQEDLFELYWTSAKGFLHCAHREFKDSYRAVRLCRNMQVLGAYAFLSIVKGKSYFARYIPQAWRLLHQWINGPCNGLYPELQRRINSIQTTRKEAVGKK